MQAAKRKRKSQKRLDAALRAAQAAKERDRLWKSEACGPWRPIAPPKTSGEESEAGKEGRVEER